MTPRAVDPAIQRLFEEADSLPECAARASVLERAAATADSLNDLDSAWQARCRLLASIAVLATPRHESLFVSLAWCLAVSDRDPERFDVGRVLWQYKWVVEQAPLHAKIPRRVVEALADDLETRFRRAKWGARAGIHKRIGMHQLMGEFDAALRLVPAWKAAPRDRGADCVACELSGFVQLLIEAGRHAEAIREAQPILRRNLRCATVPHSTFGELLISFQLLGRNDDAVSAYEKGRRLVLEMDEFGATLAAPYILFAAQTGRIDDAVDLLRRRLPAYAELQADYQRVRVFGRLWRAFQSLESHGLRQLELPHVKGWVTTTPAEVEPLRARCRDEAFRGATALDARNGNDALHRWLTRLEA